MGHIMIMQRLLQSLSYQELEHQEEQYPKEQTLVISVG
jgi:hypothetical protein